MKAARYVPQRPVKGCPERRRPINHEVDLSVSGLDGRYGTIYRFGSVQSRAEPALTTVRNPRKHQHLVLFEGNAGRRVIAVVAEVVTRGGPN